MAIASKAATIGILIISLAVGLVFYYFFSHLPKKVKKRYTGELISQLINFVLFVWVGKILLNFTIFIQDPLAVLAYPGDSNAFYIAVLLTAITVLYKVYRKNLNLYVFAESFTYVFLFSLFFYEFLQMVLVEDIFSLGYLTISAILLITLFFIHSLVTPFVLLMIIISGWTAGMFILSYIYPFVAIFGYLLDWSFIISFLIFCWAILFFMKGKGKDNGTY